MLGLARSGGTASPGRGGYRRTVAAAILLLSTSLRGEQLPLRLYTTADGLAHDRVKKIVVDRGGFVWFCTQEGLSRFDGRRFVSLGAAAGLPNPSSNDLLETPQGFWVATNGGGVALFDPASPAPRLRPIATGPDAASRVNVLARDADGSLWAGTDGGLFRLELRTSGSQAEAFRPVALGIPGRDDASVAVWALLPTQDGLLVGTSHGLSRVTAGSGARVLARGDGGSAPVLALAGQADGLVLVGWGRDQGLELLDGRLNPVRRWGTGDGLPNGVVTALLVSGRRTYVGTENGIAILSDSGLTAYTTSDGTSDRRVSSLAEDRNGGVWIGTPEGGALRLERTNATIFGRTDGVGKPTFFFGGPAGEVCGVSDGWKIACYDGGRFTTLATGFSRSLPASTWRALLSVLRDHEGALWLGTSRGLYRFPSLSRLSDLAIAEPLAVFSRSEGLANEAVWRLVEDGAGDIWIGSFGPVNDPLTVWHRSTNRLERFGAAAGLPAFGSPSTVALDRAGSVWISYRDGTLARFRDGRFTVFSGRSGFPAAHVTAFDSDGAGRLWGTTLGAGLLRVDDPGGDEPRARLYGPAEGVKDYWLSAVVVDGSGRVVFGNGRELLTFDPAAGSVGKLLPDRVLVQSGLSCSFRDRAGALWFGTWRGALRVLPEPERTASPAHPRIASVNVSGIPWPVPGTGATSLDIGEIAPSANLAIEVFGLGAMGRPLAFTHVLEGLETGWSPPAEEMTVHFGRFPAGRYRFHVRVAGTAAGNDGEAVVSFAVPAPIWRRWWFLAGAASLLAGTGWAAKALQIRNRRALEAERSRIATDLHDDLGAGLSRISILSEVATLAARSGESPADAVARIAEASRELDERLSEGIWTVDPTHDDLGSLGQRLRLLAEEVLEPAEISSRVEVPDGAEKVRIRPDRRREIYLVLKEGITNAARHSGAGFVDLAVTRSGHRIVFRLSDDGHGFTPGGHREADRLVGGHGLRNMETRARALGATFTIDSAPGRGTTLTLDVPEARDA
jgi:signal transduction histidine kinase/ligand-binding sensor domain-containing protein